jgi:hypothetical protein
MYNKIIYFMPLFLHIFHLEIFSINKNSHEFWPFPMDFEYFVDDPFPLCAPYGYG